MTFTRQLTVLVACSVVGLAATAGCCVWPLQHTGALPPLTRTSAWLRLYSLGNSNLDVLLVTLLSVAVTHGALMPALTAAPRRSPPCFPRISRCASAASYVAQSLLFCKAIAVAVLCGDEVLPTRDGHTGIACLYAAIGCAVCTVWAQGACFRELQAAWTSQVTSNGEGGGSIHEPLLARAPSSALAPGLSGIILESSSKAGNPEAATGVGQQNSEAQAGVEARHASAEGVGEDGQEPAAKLKPATVMQLLGLAVPDTHILIIAFSAGMCAAIGQALIPYYTGKGIDAAGEGTGWHHFHDLIRDLALTALATAAFTAVRGSLFTVVSVRLNKRLREQLFAQLLKQDTGFFDTTKTGEITSRLSADTTTVADQISLNANCFVRSVMQCLGVLGFMFAASWRLTVVTFVLVPVNLQVCAVYGRYYKRLSRDMQSALAAANVVAEEVISSVTTVRAHAAERGLLAAYSGELLKYYYLTMRAAGAYALYISINTFLPQAVAAIVLLYGGRLVFAGAMGRGDLVSFMLYQSSLAAAMSIIGDVFSALTSAVGAAEKVLELVNRVPRDPPAGAHAPAAFQGRVELRAVHFAYPSRPERDVLRGVSMCIEPGEAVALVGPSGSGKSSVVKLMERFYLPRRGAVLYDGRDVNDYDPAWLKRRVAMVGQEPVLYGRSIYRNIVFGLEAADGAGAAPTREQVIEVAKMANAHDFIMELPQGYNTECGDRGSALSGGQKQRVAIARALIRNPSVLLLDEATSALDTESEGLVQEALDRVMVGRTVVIIAHRLSTVQNANRIIVMARGEVAESGTQEALTAANGVFAGLVRRQFRSTSIMSMASETALSEMAGGGT